MEVGSGAKAARVSLVFTGGLSVGLCSERPAASYPRKGKPVMRPGRKAKVPLLWIAWLPKGKRPTVFAAQRQCCGVSPGCTESMKEASSSSFGVLKR